MTLSSTPPITYLDDVAIIGRRETSERNEMILSSIPSSSNQAELDLRQAATRLATAPLVHLVPGAVTLSRWLTTEADQLANGVPSETRREALAFTLLTQSWGRG